LLPHFFSRAHQCLADARGNKALRNWMSLPSLTLNVAEPFQTTSESIMSAVVGSHGGWVCNVPVLISGRGELIQPEN